MHKLCIGLFLMQARVCQVAGQLGQAKHERDFFGTNRNRKIMASLCAREIMTNFRCEKVAFLMRIRGREYFFKSASLEAIMMNS